MKISKMNKLTKIQLLSIMIIIISISCTPDPPAINVELDPTPYGLEYGNLPTPSLPEDNTLTQQGVQLGRMFFYEKMLSRDNTQACADCHRQEHGFSDTTQFSIGIQMLPGKRQAMSVLNMAWNNNGFFWDGRSHLLRDQALLPIQDELEMDETLENVVSKLSSSKIYKDQFIRAFGNDQITETKISLALEQFMMSIVSYDSKYDQFVAGKVQLTESEERGRQLFETEYNPFFPEFSGADCQHCHSGYNFENDQYMNNGLDRDIDFLDMGREVVSGREDDRAKFKVPTLRNIALTPPYMHDGRFKTLEEVVDHYNEDIHPSGTVDPAILATKDTGLMLTDQDKVDLVNFLHTLTDESFLNDKRYGSPF